MKIIKKLLIILLIIILLPLNSVLAFYFYDDEDYYDYNDGYYNEGTNYSNSNSIIINDMDYHMKVNKNHSYDIQINETVTINTYLHGIYRAIAKHGTYYREVDGKETSTPYNAIIKNVQVESGQPFETSNDGDAFIIQIGNPNQLVTGVQKYSYSYTYDPGDDGSTSYDDVYQNILSQYMENPIEHLSITIDMPKDFDANNVQFFNGEYGSTDANLINFSVKGKQILAENTGIIYPGNVVTLRVALPDGYFQNVFTGKEYLPIYYGIAAVILILGVLLYLLKGRSSKPLEPVTFYPPDNLDSAQVAFILNNSVSNEMLVSLLIYFADKGWLTIENLSPNQNYPQFQINKIQDIPYDRPNFEKRIFNAIFSRTDNPELSDLTGKRYMGNAFISAKEELVDWFSGDHQIVAGSTYLTKTLIFLLILINAVAFSFVTSFVLLRELDFFIILIFGGLLLVGGGILNFSHKKTAFISSILVLGIGLVITFFLSKSIFLSLTGPLCSFVLGYLGYLSYKRTPLGNRWYGECRAFRHFIETAELDRLKLLVEENPEYYYNILPYAYAMGLTDKWAKNFEGIAINPPNWYVDPYLNMQLFRSLYFMNMFNHGIARNITRINTQALRSMGSRGFGGGGFSGGGFGGGGAGGMGGGGW